jgi:hypothetical protein
MISTSRGRSTQEAVFRKEQGLQGTAEGRDILDRILRMTSTPFGEATDTTGFERGVLSQIADVVGGKTALAGARPTAEAFGAPFAEALGGFAKTRLAKQQGDISNLVALAPLLMERIFTGQKGKSKERSFGIGV